MSFAIFKVMLLGLLRDRGTLAMSFVMPPLIYVIFASIFAGTGGTGISLRAAVFDKPQTIATQRLKRAIESDPVMRSPAREPTSAEDVEAMVHEDLADVGIVIANDPAASNRDASPVVIYGDAAKAMAAATTAGRIQQIFGEKLPDVAYRRVLAEFERAIEPFTPDQRSRADGIIDFIGRSASPGASQALKESVAKRAMPPLIKQILVTGTGKAQAAVVYYAGAVAILFLMYSAMHGAMSLIDERENGIIDRIIQGRTGSGALLRGKFLFLLLQGIAQAGLIFLIAAWIYDVDVLFRWEGCLLTTIAASAACAGLGLALASACRNRQQAQTLSTFLVLVLAAIGGSMVPRFLMPAWLQDLSWVIPNAWVIEAYNRLLWRRAGLDDVLPEISALFVFAAAMLGLAWLLLRYRSLTR